MDDLLIDIGGSGTETETLAEGARLFWDSLAKLKRSNVCGDDELRPRWMDNRSQTVTIPLIRKLASVASDAGDVSRTR